MKTLGLLGRCLVITALLLTISPLVEAQDDGAVPMGALIAIVVVVFFGTIVGVICFIQICIKNYNPFDYFLLVCNKDTKPVKEKTSIHDVRRNELIIAQKRDLNSQRTEVNTQRTEVNTQRTQVISQRTEVKSHTTEVNMQKTDLNSHAAATRQIRVMKMEDLYAKVNKPGKQPVIEDTTEVDGGLDNHGHTVSTDVFTKETVSSETRAIDNIYAQSTRTQREKVFVHDSNIILREKPTRYGSDSYREDMVDGEVRTDRYTYSTGYTPSTSRERLVVNVPGDDSERMKYYLEEAEGRREVYTNESGQRVVMVRGEPEVQHIGTNLNIESEENSQSKEEQHGARRVVTTTTTVVTEEYQQEPGENIQQEHEISSTNRVENIEVSRNYIVDDTDDAQVQAAIQEIDTVTSEEPEQVSEGNERRVVTTTTTVTTTKNEQQIPDAPPPPPVVTEHREVHYVRHQAEDRPDIPAPDYPIEQTHVVQRGQSMRERYYPIEQTREVQRGQSMRERYLVSNTGGEASREYQEMQTRVARGREARYTIHGQPETRVVRVESQSKPKNETTVVRREYREVHEPQQNEQHSEVRREERVIESIPQTQRQSQRTVVTREERIIRGEVSEGYQTPLNLDEGTVIIEEYTEITGPTSTKHVYVTEDKHGERTIITREEEIVEVHDSVTAVDETTHEAPEAEVTYRVIKRSSEMEGPQVETTERRNKDWFVSSASLMAPASMDTVYMELGSDENRQDSTATKTTTYTLDMGEQ